LDIVLSSYNGQNFISEQLRSLQLYFGYAEKVCRVLVVDDASDDHTAAIVADFSKHDPWIVWFPSLQGRQGVVANFVRGLNCLLCDIMCKKLTRCLHFFSREYINFKCEI